MVWCQTVKTAPLDKVNQAATMVLVMKYGKMVTKGHLPLTTEETDSFREMFVSLCKKWACIELGEVFVAPGYGDSVVFKVNFKSPIITRNMYKSRVNAKSIMLCVSKDTGYIDNYDWVKKWLSTLQRIGTTMTPHPHSNIPVICTSTARKSSSNAARWSISAVGATFTVRNLLTLRTKSI